MDRIIDVGLILIFNSSNELVLQREFRDTNFEKIRIDNTTGQFTIKLIFDRNIITKEITIN